ncbi:MAG: hypothetical protein A2Y63_03335 [Candidatus Riflebacteria bacterium RBG_13_59_9]|nr:MAG: hypothetical protein A2Y63_03335 [Candidatus Riflebacteria bacterium RBG_13_59_9]
MTRCFYHPEKETGTRCERCGKPVCEACSISHQGRVICQRCKKQAEDPTVAGAQPRHGCRESREAAWAGLVIPGLAQILKGEMYKGSLLLLYFLIAIASNMGMFVAIAYGLSIWDFFSPLVEEESKGRALISLRLFAGVVIVAVGVILLANNLNASLRLFSYQLAPTLATLLTLALGLFILWYHYDRRNEGAHHDD